MPTGPEIPLSQNALRQEIFRTLYLEPKVNAHLGSPSAHEISKLAKLRDVQDSNA